MSNETTGTMKIIHLSQATTHIDSSVTPEKQHHYWYGGEMATIEAGGYRFHIEATGDMRARLYNHPYRSEPKYEDCLEDLKDCSNTGYVGSVLEQYIQNDHELYQLIYDEHSSYQLSLSNNNWWECFVTTPEGVWHDLMWDLNASYLNEAIDEVLTVLQEGLEVNDTILQLNV